MENRSRSLAACLSLFALLVSPALAAEEAVTLPEEGAVTEIERGLAMQARAQQIKLEAEAERAAEEEACGKKFFVNDCRSAANERYLEKLAESRKLAAEGREVEITQRKKDLEALRAEQARDATAREEKNIERGKTIAEEQKAREAAYQERLEKHAQKTATKAQKAAKERENARMREEKSQEKKARREEERARKASRRSAPLHSE